MGLDMGRGGWSARAEVQHARGQGHVPATEQPTAAYTLVHLSARYRLSHGPRDTLLFVKLHNATDQLAYNASTTSTVQPLSPLPGRSLSAGVRFTF
jgi:iron complex outermembrane receptor protein